MPDRHLVDVHILLIRGAELLLTERRGGEWDRMWHLPSGKLDAGDDIFTAAVREAEEEVGVLIDPADLDHVHCIHVTGSGPEPRIGHFFVTTRWVGEPTNREPEKCHRLAWFGLDSLPANVIEYPAAGIDAYRRGLRGMSIMGWGVSRPASNRT